MAAELPVNRATSVGAVIVTFQPDVEALRTAVEALDGQVQHVVVVDNGSATNLIEDVRAVADKAGAEVLALAENLGLATAQNHGIDRVRELGCSHVMLFDQDSVLAPGAVEAMLVELASLAAAGHRVAAVGPVFRDPRENRPAPFVRVGFPVSTKVWCEQATSVQCDFLISSGVLIPLAVLDELGAMDDGLFIDNIDLEWSFRARARGYVLFGVCGASMAHHLGDYRIAVLGTRFTRVRHSPIRLYFIMRNRVLLYRRPHTPRVWIAQDVIRIPMKFVIFSVLAEPRWTNIRYMSRGIVDGLRGRTGDCPAVRP